MKERSDRTAERLQNWLKALATVGAAVNQGISLNSLLDMIARTASELMGYDFCSVTVPEDKGNFLVISGSHGLSEDYIREVNAVHPIRLQGMSLPSPSAQAFKLGIPIQIEDTTTDASFGPWAAAAQLQGFTSMIAVPLNAPSGTLGTMNCFTRRPHLFDRDEISLLTVLADQASIAINTARLRSEQSRIIAELRSLNETLAEQYDLQRRVAEVHDRLTALALGGGGIADVGTVLAELLGRTVVVRSEQGTVVCGPEFDTDSLLEGPTEETDRAQDTSLYGGATSDHSDIQLHLRDGSLITVVRTPVVIKEEVAAWIWTVGSLADLAPFDRRAIEHAATVMALEFLHGFSTAESLWYRSGELLSNLLAGPGSAGPALRTLTQSLAQDLSQPHAMIVTQHNGAAENDVRSRLAGIVARLTQDTAPRALIGVHHDYVVTLLPLGPKQLESVHNISEEIRQRLSEGEPGTLSAVISPVADLAAYFEAFSIARGAVELARLREMSGQTLVLADLGIAEFFLQVPDTARLRSYCDEVLGPLRRYDASHGAALVRTLKVLVRYDLDAQATGEQLGVHTATITRRRKLIEQLLGSKLTTIAFLTQVATALQLEEVIAARDTGPTAPLR